MSLVIYGMVFLGSALMVINIRNYVLYARSVQEKANWGNEKKVLYIPIVLLVLFLGGYLAVGFFGKPDLIVSGILFGGSIFVYIIFQLVEKITNQVQEHEHLEAELSVAETTSVMKTRFLSSMSHEMRTPMNAIVGLDTIALKNPDLPEETREQLTKIGVSASHLLCLIDNLLDMSAIESGELLIKEEPFYLKDVLALTDAVMQNQCEEKGLVYWSNSKELQDERFLGDSLKLKQMLLFLLDNAVKYTPSPGQVTFTAQMEDLGDGFAALRFTVKDNGIGMDPDYLKQIFTPFSREDASNTTFYSGSGLGLSLGRNIARLMDGDITVQSEKGKGSTFLVHVRLKKLDGAEEDEEEVIEDAEFFKNCRVLIAEDIDLNAEILQDQLELEEIASDRARDGVEVVQMFEKSEPGYYSAILMDLRMPQMDGLSAARTIRAMERKDAADIPIIALTANASSEDRRAVLEAGMNYHLAKPVEIEQLCLVLKRFIRKNVVPAK